MNPNKSKLAIALENSNKCHNEQYMERLIDSPALQYNRELNYILVNLPKGEEHLVDRKCIDEYYSWLTEYLRDEIARLGIERDKIKTSLGNDNLDKNQKDMYIRLLINPSDEQIENMVGFDPKKDKSLLITDNKLLIALRSEMNGVRTQAQSELKDEIELIYKKRIEKITDMIIKYENVLMKFKDKINDVEANKRIFELKQSKMSNNNNNSNNNLSKSKKKKKKKKKNKKMNNVGGARKKTKKVNS
jgi:hypothetical protein